jgi:hypothetical protein
MNILEAMDRMRMGFRVRREQNVGRTVAKAWLEIRHIPNPLDDEEAEPGEVIYFVVEPCMIAGNSAEGSANQWTPKQSDLFADDFVIVGTKM